MHPWPGPPRREGPGSVDRCPEVIRVDKVQVACDGSGEISPALGHPRVYLRIDEELGIVECGYCDRRFVLEGGPADQQAA